MLMSSSPFSSWEDCQTIANVLAGANCFRGSNFHDVVSNCISSKQLNIEDYCSDTLC